MQLIKNKDRSRLTRAALGKIPCDLSIDNVKLVNVATGEIYPAGVDVLDGVVVYGILNDTTLLTDSAIEHFVAMLCDDHGDQSMPH